MRRVDKGLVVVLVLSAVLRIIPMLEWWNRPCVRDECNYRILAGSIVRGEGMVGTKGWLWAPGYPSIIALHAELFGALNSVKWTQVGAAMLTTWLIWRFTRAAYGGRAAVIAAALYALNPTHIFYASSLWSECFYTALLFGAVTALGWTRGEAADGAPVAGGGSWRRGALVGVLLGACVLFRGVATYLLPCVAAALLWGRWRAAEAWRAVAAMALAAALVVAPYSAWATQRFGGLVVSDRTLGQMMWLGNNDYSPITFDFGNGLIREELYDKVIATGRDHCGFDDDPVRQDACELQAGLDWISAHPGEFLARVPLRVSQMLTPHSLLTRNLRTGRWHGLPDWFDEVLVASVVGFSFATMVGGTLGLFARGRGWYAAAATLIVGYHVAAIACLAGLSRYRVPLEPLWMVYAGAFFADPQAGLDAIRASGWRRWGAAVVTGVLVGLMLRFLPAGWRGWKSW